MKQFAGWTLMPDDLEVFQLEGLQPRQCSRLKANGDRCRNRALAGSDICAPHGGNTELALGAARRRIEMVRSQLFETLIDAAEQATETYVNIMRYGKKDADKIKAADRILTLLGFQPNAPVIHVENKEAEHDDIDDRLRTLLAEAESKGRVGDIIDAEVIDERTDEDG
jgi:hypothetical protein